MGTKLINIHINIHIDKHNIYELHRTQSAE